MESDFTRRLRGFVAFSAVLLGALMASGAIADGEGMRVAAALLTSLHWAAYQLGLRAPAESERMQIP